MATLNPDDLRALPPEYLAENNNSQKLMDISVAFMVISTVVYALFLLSRTLYSSRNGWETWVLYPLSYLLTMGACVIGILLVQIGGAGRHMAYFLLNDPSTISMYLKLQTATEFVYMAGVTVPKVTILLLYLRIFTQREIRIITWIVIGVVVTNFFTSGVIVGFTICQPFAYKWDKTIPGGRCANLMAAYRLISIPNLLTDLAILFLPFYPLWHLQMNKTLKVGIFLTFMTGSLGIITAIIRFIGFYTVDLLSDPTYLSVDTMSYSVIEPGAYFICSCLPGIKPLLRVLYKKSGLTGASSRPSKSSATASNGLDIPLGNPSGSYKTSVSASKRPNFNKDDDRTGFIRLEEEVRVDNTPTNVSEGKREFC
ncbi:hypothetical protein DL764_009172 [Monosporascus ibericus]|uniref:Rhodopsin domain-containing protein n=1 Tax=Monosporascus ibericus TaxID=155417 RepID=A0A4Q4SVN2_9PEZI|nr:hypothetical protein DL764_009172 [Monosporascus ibericus]